MSFYTRAEGIILKYLQFLNEKNVLRDFAIDKSVARSLYMDEFKPQHNIVRFPFSTMCRVMQEFGLISIKSKGTRVIHFKSDLFTYAVRYHKNDAVDESATTSEPNVSGKPTKSSKKDKSKDSSSRKCNVCNLTFSNQDMLDKHEASEKHLERVKVASDKSKEDESGVTVEIVDGFGGGPETVIVRINTQQTVAVNILNRSRHVYSVENIKAVTNSEAIDLARLAIPFILNSNYKQTLNLNVKFKDCIFYTYALLIKLKNTSTSQNMEVLKKIMFHVHSELVDDLHPVQPYKPFVKPNIRDTDFEIIPGERPSPRTANVKLAMQLKPYPLPQYVNILLEHNFEEFPNMSIIEKEMLHYILKDFASFSRNGTFDIKNYFSISQLRLYIEECQMKINIRMYDMENQTLKSVRGQRNNIFELTVPGLAEHRPSLLRGDSVFVQENQDTKTKYEGIVHKVNKDSVYLGFSYRFAETVHINNKKYSVSFGYNRLPLRAEHQAINLAKIHGIIPLLCSNGIETSRLTSFNILWRNPNIVNNRKQQAAIEHILSETSRPMPYLIFGPPGTGKTVTVVEAILQIRVHKPKHKILVSTPSNYAADIIAKRLITGGLTKLELFRYVAPSYSYDLIDTAVKPYTNFKDEFYHPSNQELLKYSVIITTLVTAARLVNGGTPAGHFSYVFIDESGHATESETLIPITGILTSAQTPGVINGQVILAGDPQQLGPIIHSSRANSFGYGLSLLERLMTKSPIYKKSDGSYNDYVLTKLVQSYRSHPTILSLPNELFYDKELIPPTDRTLTDLAVGWEELPNANFPVIFHSVIGKDEREANSPSFFNVQEIEIVTTYLEKLINCRLKGMVISPEHIGVITPYRKQVYKLQAVFRKKQWNNLMVGSVEQFQGQERLVIIVSTVRSRPEFSTHDEKFHLGFLKNPKRFNVALTRAKALLIVIGNPNLLQYDEYWRRFIQYCVDNKSTRGTAFQLKTPVIVEEVNGEVEEDEANFSRGNV